MGCALKANADLLPIRSLWRGSEEKRRGNGLSRHRTIYSAISLLELASRGLQVLSRLCPDSPSTLQRLRPGEHSMP
jgi:hypothetical protein